MRSVILLFLLIVTICNHLSRAQQQQTNYERQEENPSLDKSQSKVPLGKGIGQREYYIPSYSSPQIIQRPQEFIYPNNFRNSYQYSSYKYPNKAPLFYNQRQRQWSTDSTLGKSIHRNYRYKNPIVYDTSVDSVSNEFNGDLNNDFENRKLENSPQNNENTIRDEKQRTEPINNSLKNKIKDFDAEEHKLTKAETLKPQYDSKQKNKFNDFVLSPVMRRKSSTNDNSMYTSALRASDQRSIPIPMARQQNTDSQNGSLGDIYFVAIVACVSAVAIFGVIGAGICVYKVQQSNKAAADVDYPAYGVVGPASKDNNSTGNLSPSGDRKLAQSAQMYHYHHQKQQMIASEKAVTNRRNSASDVESDEENEEGEYTVYECPGLAPTGEMEVKNPLFHDDITPVSSPSVTGNNTKEK